LANWQKSLSLDPSNFNVEIEMGMLLAEKGQAQDGLAHLRKAVEIAPDAAETHNALGWELAQAGQIDAAVEQLQKAVALSPTTAPYYANLGHVLESRGDAPAAVTALEKAVELSRGIEPHFLADLADAYNKAGRFAEAIQTASRARDVALQIRDEKLAEKLQEDVSRFELEKQKANIP